MEGAGQAKGMGNIELLVLLVSVIKTHQFSCHRPEPFLNPASCISDIVSYQRFTMHILRIRYGY